MQVWRLVTQAPERLSLPVLAALCDIFGVTPAQLIATRAENIPARRRAASGSGGRGGRHRPERAAAGPRPAAPRVVTPAPEEADLRPVRATAPGQPLRSLTGTCAIPCLDVALSAAGTCPGCGTAGRVLPGLRETA